MQQQGEIERGGMNRLEATLLLLTKGGPATSGVNMLFPLQQTANNKLFPKTKWGREKSLNYQNEARFTETQIGGGAKADFKLQYNEAKATEQENTQQDISCTCPHGA